MSNTIEFTVSVAITVANDGAISSGAALRGVRPWEMSPRLRSAIADALRELADELACEDE